MIPLFIRNGQWLKFRGNLEGAFHARDGRVVGIACIGPYENDGMAFIAVVDPDGDNLMVDVGGKLVEAKVAVNQPDLEPITNRKDIPPKRIAHLPLSWQPRG